MTPVAESTTARYERKFLISAVPPGIVDAVIRSHPARFRQLHPPRVVNNCYFDSPLLGAYHEAVEGHRRRIKVRIRWYGDLFGPIPKPVLEIKGKNALVGRKAQYPLAPMELDRRSELGPLRDWVAGADVPAEVLQRFGTLRPTLINRYTRRYLISADRGFRLTVDTDLAYHRVTPPRLPVAAPPRDTVTAILELKYAEGGDDVVSFVTNHLPFRLTKSSKYVMGLRRLGRW